MSLGGGLEGDTLATRLAPAFLCRHQCRLRPRVELSLAGDPAALPLFVSDGMGALFTAVGNLSELPSCLCPASLNCFLADCVDGLRGLAVRARVKSLPGFVQHR
jgi:hypothetical protein